MPSIESLSASHLSSIAYPRTGKRGVPQQFARRLYEMVQSEAKLASASPEDEVLIKWSDSGLAFGIHDVKRFTDLVLPKYFRTKKFSSFQRNLNLYGFSKVRRGPDTDMYAHGSFVRGKPELLMHLRKCTTASRKLARSMDESDASSSSSGSDEGPRVVSPTTPPRTISGPLKLSNANSAPLWATFQNRPLMPKTKCQPHQPSFGSGIGRLDLLALVVEHAA